MTANTNQPNRGNQGGGQTGGGQAGGKAAGQQGQQHEGQGGSSRELGSRFGATGQGQPSSRGDATSSGGDETSRYLDAIEENVRKLRSAIGASGDDASQGETREGSGRSERQDSGSQGSRGV
jgi:hypothetical protein